MGQKWDSGTKKWDSVPKWAKNSPVVGNETPILVGNEAHQNTLLSRFCPGSGPLCPTLSRQKMRIQVVSAERGTVFRRSPALQMSCSERRIRVKFSELNPNIIASEDLVLAALSDQPRSVSVQIPQATKETPRLMTKFLFVIPSEYQYVRYSFHVSNPSQKIRRVSRSSKHSTLVIRMTTFFSGIMQTNPLT